MKMRPNRIKQKLAGGDIAYMAVGITDPDDIEHRITSRTKAIVAVHWSGHPCEMDKICAIAKKHGVKVIEDVSHAHGGRYKGQKVGTFGDVAAMSCMSGKSLAVGEVRALGRRGKPRLAPQVQLRSARWLNLACGRAGCW